MALEAKEVEADYIILVEGMIARLNRKLKYISMIPSRLQCRAQGFLEEARDQAAMPVPSLFASVSHWSKAQEGTDAILCLRPCNTGPPSYYLTATEVAALKDCATQWWIPMKPG
jgi:hypothetical protein